MTIRRALRVNVLGALAVLLIFACVVTPERAGAGYTAPGWVIQPWDDPSQWSKVETLIKSGSFGAGDGASIEDQFFRMNGTPELIANRATMAEGLADARIAAAPLMEMPTTVSLGPLIVEGVAAFGMGYVVGTVLNKTLIHSETWWGGTVDGTITAAEVHKIVGRGSSATYLNIQVEGPAYYLTTKWSSGTWCAAWSGTSGECRKAYATYPQARFPDILWRTNPSGTLVMLWPSPEKALDREVTLSPYIGQSYTAASDLPWPEYDSAEGEDIRTAIAAHPVLQDELNHLLNPTYVDDPEYGNAPTPDPLIPEGDPETGQPPYTAPEDPIPGGGSTSCPEPMATDLDFGPLQATGLQDKFPFGVFAWLHTTLSGWAGTAVAPEFSFEILGHQQNVSLDVASPAMAILRTVMLALSGLGMVWWMATALLGMRGE